MELPIDALRRGTRTPLLLSQLLFVVMGSHRLRARSALAQASWCTQQRAQCLFVLDEPGRRRQGEHDEATEADAGGAVKDGQPGDSATDGGAEAGRRLRAVTFDAARDWGDRYAQPGSPASGEMPVVRIRGAAPPRRCVCNESDVTAGDRGESFFCRQHRAATLEAQYRFLPALQHVRSSPRFERGDLRWVVLVDDDSFVFAERLRAPADAARAETPARRRHSLRRRATITRLPPQTRHSQRRPMPQRAAWFASSPLWPSVLTALPPLLPAARRRALLALLDEEAPLYTGDFVSSPQAFRRSGVQDFACGGGGTVLSAAALRRMDVAACIERYHSRCMQAKPFLPAPVHLPKARP